MKDIKHIRRDFLFGSLGHAPGVGLGGTGGLSGPKNTLLSHCLIQPDLVCELLT